MMHCYQIYGLSVSSELALPLPPSEAKVDITICLNQIPAFCIPADTSKAVTALNRSCVLMDMKGIAKYLIRNGNEIVVEPYPDANGNTVRLYLLGGSLGILLHQRGIMPLHGCGVVRNDKAILFLGESGYGKSTLAEAFRRKGYPLLSDDVSALTFSADKTVTVAPSYPKLGLMEDATVNFNIPLEGLQEAHHKVSKYSVPIREGFCAVSKKLDRIYILQPSNKDRIRIEQLSNKENIPHLHHNTYRKKAVKKLGLLKEHLDQCQNLAGNYPVRILHRPRDLSRLPELIEFLEHDFK